MKRRSTASLAGFLLAAGLAGCSSTKSQSTVQSDWASPNRQFGRLVITQQLCGVQPEDTVNRKAIEVAQAAHAAFAALPGTEVMDDHVLREALPQAKPWAAMSDYEAVVAGRKAGLDTICMLTMNDYGGYLSIGLLPLPGFGTWTQAGYRVRMIDVKSG